MSAPEIEIVNLSHRYPDGSEALKNISITIAPDVSLCLAGPNGAGKSSFLLALANLIRASGSIRFDQRERSRQDRSNVGLVFQNPDDQLFCATLYDEIAFGPRARDLNESEVRLRVEEALRAVELEGCENRAPQNLSLGAKKLAAIAATLATRPKILALDEPWANLDMQGADALSKVIESFDGTIIVATHDLYRASQICDSIAIIDAGRIKAHGPIEAILADRGLLGAHRLEFGRWIKAPKGVDPQPAGGYTQTS